MDQKNKLREFIKKTIKEKNKEKILNQVKAKLDQLKVENLI